MKNNNKVFTFWEGNMPDYIKLCMETWKFPYTVLNYENLNNYTSLSIDLLKKFTLPQIADCVRVHILRDNGGYWLDTDTIILSEELPTTNMIGNPVTRSNTIGYLYSQKPNLDLFVEWADYQKSVIDNPNLDYGLWSILGNSFTDPYVKAHNEVSISSVDNCWPETYMIKSDIQRHEKYKMFYFKNNFKLSDLRPTNMLMLHNSWTPDWYKKLSSSEVLNRKCTLSNILKEVL